MVQVFAEVLWFFLPAMMANMAPVAAARYHWFSELDTPLDRGIKLQGKRLLGENKTVRGVVVGVAFGGITALLQAYLYTFDIGQGIALVSYQNIGFVLLLGSLLGFGALLGDAAKSFIKRRLGLNPGKSFPVFDQIDFVIGATLVVQPIASIPLLHIMVAVITIGIGSFLVSVIGVTLGIKKEI